MKQLITILCLVPLLAYGQWSNGQAAQYVIGQSGFTTSTSGTSAQSLYLPTACAVDLTTNKLYVVDLLNHRVLRYSYPITSSNPTAEAVFGQPDFSSKQINRGQANPAANSMNYPAGVCVLNDMLWVSDGPNFRLLKFNNASTKANGTDADGVLGQPDFTTAKDTCAQNRGGAYSLAISSNGTLWVGDQGNNRVLRFSNAASKPNGGSADGVLGQPNFTSNSMSGIATANNIGSVGGVAISTNGTLWVVDTYNNRVLRFDNAEAKSNGANADGVLGQSNFTSGISNTTASTLWAPDGVRVDGKGSLYVADATNNRILIYFSASAKSNGGSADVVLGQANFTSRTSSTTQSTLNYPKLIEVDNTNGKLLVADNSNNRIMIFSASSSLTFVPSSTEMPSEVNLYQNYPNPFNPATVINYRLEKTGYVSLKVFDLLGREVTTLVNSTITSGYHTAVFDGANLPSGVYFYRLQAGSYTAIRKLTLLK